MIADLEKNLPSIDGKDKMRKIRKLLKSVTIEDYDHDKLKLDQDRKKKMSYRTLIKHDSIG